MAGQAEEVKKPRYERTGSKEAGWPFNLFSWPQGSPKKGKIDSAFLEEWAGYKFYGKNKEADALQAEYEKETGKSLNSLALDEAAKPYYERFLKAEKAAKTPAQTMYGTP